MNIADNFKSLLKGKSLDKVALDDLRLAKIKLEQDQKRTANKIKDLDKQKQQTFKEGADASSQQLKVISARKMKQLDADINNQAGMLRFTSHQIRFINGLIQFKERQAGMNRSVVSNILKKLGETELYNQIAQITAQGEFDFDKLDGVIKRMENTGLSLDSYGNEEEDVLEIVRQMDAASAIKEAGDASGLEDYYQEANQALKRKDQDKNY